MAEIPTTAKRLNLQEPLEPKKSGRGIALKATFSGSSKIFRRPDVERITGLGRSTIYEWMARGEFPQPVKLGARAVGWRERDLGAWLESRKHRSTS